MSNKINRELDKELRNYRLKNLKIISYFVIPFILIVIYSFSFIGAEQSTFIGVVNSRHTILHDEGHDLSIMVEIPGYATLTRVGLPKSADIKIGSKVELSVRKSRLFGIKKYRFVKYVE